LALHWRVAGFAVLAVIAGAIGLAGVRSFHEAQTTLNPLNPERATTLVVGGVYRYSRNPMYLALLLALLGWGLYLANVFSLLAALTFVPYMNRFQIRPEERALAKAHGADFAAYCRHVRRWL
jgi:protein-S-isoprenylcysteine O-methyltransferase Ste14